MSVIELPSAKSLLIEMRVNGEYLATGTAFITNGISGPLLITNRHNVTGRDQHTEKALSKTLGLPNEILINHHSKKRLGTWTSKLEPLYDFHGQPLWKEHPTLGAKADFIALPLWHTINVEFYTYDMKNVGEDILLLPADTISVIGFPFGITAGGNLPIWATGFIASEPTIDYNGLPIQIIDCRSRQGQSGSPVVAYRSGGMIAMEDGSTVGRHGAISKFVGIYSGRINAESDLGMVWKAKAILELVNSC